LAIFQFEVTGQAMSARASQPALPARAAGGRRRTQTFEFLHRN